MIERLRRAGILGINRRNIEFTLGENPRRLYPLVDDKLATKKLCASAGIPTASVVAVARMHSEIPELLASLEGRGDFVLKPARGAMGNGIVVVEHAEERQWRTISGRTWTWDDAHYHAASVISGLYALGGQPDVAFAEERLEVHPALRRVSLQGVPDIRVVIYRGVPVMAMTRLPTRESDGKANLHQGAVGAGIDLETGCTNHAVCHNRPVRLHPDTEQSVIGLEIPGFAEALSIAVRSSDLTGLGYMGADIVIDAQRGPMVLELNARPGLAIQIANRAGLAPRLQHVRTLDTASLDLETRIRVGGEMGRAFA